MTYLPPKTRQESLALLFLLYRGCWEGLLWEALARFEQAEKANALLIKAD